MSLRWVSSLVLVLVYLGAADGFGAEAPYKVAYASFGPINTAIFIADADGSHERVLVERSNLDGNPSFSPDGRWVLFTSRRDGSAEIYRVQPDGTRLERLTDHPAFDDQAVMSPDGTRVAFVSSRSGQADIWVLGLRTKQLRNLTDHPGGDYRPAWSPDGQWIVFTSDRDSEGGQARTPGNLFAPPQSTEIYVVRADGSGLRRLTDSDASVGGACWSPDGRQIAFYEASPMDWRGMNTDFLTGVPAATSQIVSVEVATGAREVRTSGAGRKLAPQWVGPGRLGYIRGDVNEKRGVTQRVNYRSEGIGFTDGSFGPKGAFSNVSWSPDGKRMVFHRELEATWPPVMDTFSRDARFRVVRTGVFPSYSPNGKKLVSNTAFAATFHNSVVVMNPDGTDRQVVFDDPTLNCNAPVWSPTGDRIAFGLGRYNAGSKGPNPVPSSVVIIPADGSELRKLTPADGVNYGFPSWSPDGKRMVLRRAGPKWRGLLILDLASGALTPMSSGEWNDNFPAWSPNGDSILFTSDRDGDWELYTVRPDGTGLKRLTTSSGNDAHATWSFDGQWIAFSSARGGFKDEMPRAEGGGQGAGDIFVMRFDGTDVRRLTDDAFEEATPAFAPK